MRLALMCAVLIAFGTVINFIRAGLTTPLPRALPGCGGAGRGIEFEWGAVALIALGCWGFLRLFRSKRDEE